MKLVCLIILWPILGLSQKSAFFETTFWFKDASGNLDSIVVGHDIEANYYNNLQFGELDINVPWDSIFEVRAAHFLSWDLLDDSLILSKKIIARNEQGFDPDYNCLWFNEGIIFFVRVVNLPITIYWNRSAFENSFCRNRSILTPNLFPTILPDWYVDYEEDVDWVCLAERDSFIVSSFKDAFDFYHVDTLEGGVVDTMAAILFDSEYQGNFGPCTSTVPTINLSQNNVSVYPNPTSDFMFISDGDHLNWSVVDLFGHVNKQGSGRVIDCSTFEPGIYFINILSDSGVQLYTGKIIKM